MSKALPRRRRERLLNRSLMVSLYMHDTVCVGIVLLVVTVVVAMIEGFFGLEGRGYVVVGFVVGFGFEFFLGAGAGAVVELEETVAGGALFAEEFIGVFRGGRVCVSGGFASVACKGERVSLCCALGHVVRKGEASGWMAKMYQMTGILDKDERRRLTGSIVERHLQPREVETYQGATCWKTGTYYANAYFEVCPEGHRGLIICGWQAQWEFRDMMGCRKGDTYMMDHSKHPSS